MEYDGVKIKSLSQKELITMYKTTWETFKAWLSHIEKKLGSQRGRRYTPKQVRIIFEHLGTP